MQFNLAAPGECSNVLFNRLHLPPPAGAKKLKNKSFSTKVTEELECVLDARVLSRF